MDLEPISDSQNAIAQYDNTTTQSLARRPPDSHFYQANQQAQGVAPYMTSPAMRTPTSVNSIRPDISASGMIGSLPEQTESHEYFGSSSAGSFIDQVRRTVKQKMRQPDHNIQRNSVQSTQRRPSLLQRHPSVPELSLPARTKADQLIQIYWDIVHVLYPFVDKEETIHKYQSLWTGNAGFEEDHIFVSLLNVIFALSCQLNGAIEARSRENSARIYFQRAKELFDLWGTGTFECVQVYLLLGQYFQSTNEPHQCWMMIGNAIRTAQSLGLHLPETTDRISPLRQRELTRKVWHGCILMDRIVSMTYGRPPMINSSVAAAVPRPLAIDEERLARSHNVQSHQSREPSILDFFVHTLELYDILYDILVGFYSSSSSSGNISVNQAWDKYLRGSDSTLDIERRLVRWESSLPPHLKLTDLDVQTKTNKHFRRQAIILHQR